MRRLALRTFIGCLFGLTLCLAGCGDPLPEGTVVTGKIVKGGQPLKVAPDENDYNYVEIVLVPTFQVGGNEPARVNEDGTFTVDGGHGGGIKPGKYRIAVYQWEPNPDRDKLGGKFSEERSPIEKEISGDTADLGTIDLDKPKG